MVVAQDPKCRVCKEAPEAVKYILCESTPGKIKYIGHSTRHDFTKDKVLYIKYLHSE